jgi:hypothetical protein
MSVKAMLHTGDGVFYSAEVAGRRASTLLSFGKLPPFNVLASEMS